MFSGEGSSIFLKQAEKMLSQENADQEKLFGENSKAFRSVLDEVTSESYRKSVVSKEDVDNGTLRHSFARSNAEGIYGEAVNMATEYAQTHDVMDTMAYVNEQTGVEVRPSYRDTWVAVVPNDTSTVNMEKLSQLPVYEGDVYNDGNGLTVEDLNRMNRDGYTARLGDVYTHDELYKAYPSLRDAYVVMAPLGEDVYAAYDSALHTVYINVDEIDSDNPIAAATYIAEEIRHETQHAIQTFEDDIVWPNPKKRDLGVEQGSNETYWADLQEKMKTLLKEAEKVQKKAQMPELQEAIDAVKASL